MLLTYSNSIILIICLGIYCLSLKSQDFTARFGDGNIKTHPWKKRFLKYFTSLVGH